MKLRPISDDDLTYVSILLDTAFNGPEEYQRMTRLRQSGDMAMELVAEKDNGALVGYISFVRHTEPEGWWALALEAVNRDERGNGVGSKLVSYGVDAARRAGAKAITVVGEPRFYQRFQFSGNAAAGLDTPFDKSATLVYPIEKGSGSTKASLQYPTAFMLA